MRVTTVYLTFLVFSTVSCGVTEYEKLAIEHKQRCIHHKGRSISVKRDGQWQIFCNDGTVVIIEDLKE
jgi:hypothetical protein